MTAPTLRVRSATTADLDQIVALERITDNTPHWPPTTYSAILEPPQGMHPKRCLLVACEAETLKGFAVAALPADTQIAEIESIAVAASARRTGIGRTLCTAALDWCHEQGATSILLEVRANSTAAIALYTALGFVTAGRRPRYYRNPGDDALLMNRPLP